MFVCECDKYGVCWCGFVSLNSKSRLCVLCLFGVTIVCDSGTKMQKESGRDREIKHEVGRVSCNPVATLAQRERFFWGIFITPSVMNYLLCNWSAFKNPAAVRHEMRKSPEKKDVTYRIFRISRVTMRSLILLKTNAFHIFWYSRHREKKHHRISSRSQLFASNQRAAL